MNAIAGLLKERDQFSAAVEYYEAILKYDENNGEVYANLGMF
jgi:Tfp pilus assembly protein PilF